MEKMEEVTIQPNQTIYIQNLNEKIKIPDLKKQLYALFSKFGPILDIVAQKNKKMKGQAFVVFKEVTAAALAFKQMDGFELLSKKMVRTFNVTHSL
jgi:RNA recognition motif-containing protein